MKRLLAAETFAFLAALVAGLFATAAQAGGVPIEMSVGESYPDTQFQLVGPSDYQDLKVNLAAGQDVFVGIRVLASLRVQVFDPNGAPFETFIVVDKGFDGGSEEGVELHPAIGGYYTVRIAPDAPNWNFSYGPEPVIAWTYPDCRGGPATQCTIAPGKAKSASYGADNDDDAYKLKNAPPGRYVATLRTTGYVDWLDLVDGKGRVLASWHTGLVGDRRFTAIAKFILPGAGWPYYLRFRPTDASQHGRGSYTLSLVRQ